MNFAEPSTTRSKRQQTPFRFTFNWIELLALPVATSIMEAQPIALILLFSTLLFSGTSTALPLDVVSISLLLVSLQWWAMFAKHIMQHAQSEQREKRAKLLYVLGLFVAFIVVIGTHSSLFANIPALVLTFALILWCWRLALSRVLLGLSEAVVITSFKIGFFVLLAVLLIAIALSSAKYQILLDVLTYALPLFFFSSLAALSLLHLHVIKREGRRASHSGSGSHPTRMWLIQLALICGAIMVSVIILAFTFQPLMTFLSPLRNALGRLFDWLVALLNALFAHQQPVVIKTPKFKRPPLPPTYVVPHPYYNPLLVTLLLIFVLALLLLLIVAALRDWFIPKKTDEDEVRERISLRSTLKARWRKRQKRQKASLRLEPLDPLSARARYRELLQAMARSKDHLEHRRDETPVEYQTRLIKGVEEISLGQTPKDHTPSDVAILKELTSTYTLERYGGKQTDHNKQTYLRTWLPYLIKRLMGLADV